MFTQHCHLACIFLLSVLFRCAVDGHRTNAGNLFGNGMERSMPFDAVRRYKTTLSMTRTLGYWISRPARRFDPTWNWCNVSVETWESRAKRVNYYLNSIEWRANWSHINRKWSTRGRRFPSSGSIWNQRNKDCDWHEPIISLPITAGKPRLRLLQVSRN